MKAKNILFFLAVLLTSFGTFAQLNPQSLWKQIAKNNENEFFADMNNVSGPVDKRNIVIAINLLQPKGLVKSYAQSYLVNCNTNELTKTSVISFPEQGLKGDGTILNVAKETKVPEPGTVGFKYVEVACNEYKTQSVEQCQNFYNTKQYNKAIDACGRLAAKGDGFGAYVMALIYWRGKSVPPNYAEADKYMHLAVKNGYKEAEKYIDFRNRLIDENGAVWIDDHVATIGTGNESTKNLANLLEQMQSSAVNWNIYNTQYKTAILGSSGYQNIAKPKLDSEMINLKNMTKQFVDLWMAQGSEFHKKFSWQNNNWVLVAPNSAGSSAVIKVFTSQSGQVQKITLIEEGNAYQENKVIVLFGK